MANICSDDLYFYSYSNPEGLQNLWEDIEASINTSPTDAWIGRLFQCKGIPTTGICLYGTVTYKERNIDGILLELSTAWSPLYDAYRTIASHYKVSFVCRSIEPGVGIYFNTDTEGRFFPEEYMLSINDENELTPLGNKVCEVLEDWSLFSSSQEILDTFGRLGYDASSFDELKMLLEEQDIYIHSFENPYGI